MSQKRNASEQIAFRIEPEVAELWTDFVTDSLVPNRAHLICAMLMYMSAAPAQREQMQRLYARFQKGRAAVDLSDIQLAEKLTQLSSDELELVQAFRNADSDARDEAIVNLQERSSDSNARNAGIA